MPKKRPEFVVAKTSFQINRYGAAVVAGDVYRSDDPIVKAHPGKFESASDQDERLERATAAPGERRNVEVPDAG